MAGSPRHPVVPLALLRRFANATGQVMLERRDRARRAMAPVAEAAARAGLYAIAVADAGTAAGLRAVIAQSEARGAAAIDRLVQGAFPPLGEERTHLALFLAVHLLLGRRQHAVRTETVDLLDHLITTAIEERTEDDEPPDEPEEQDPEPEGGVRPPGLVVAGDTPLRVSLAGLLPLARLLAGRTWQLVRFSRPLLLTGDTPVVPWSPASQPRPLTAGPGAAAEIRVPLDPSHALILARTASAGEVIRDLGERHAAALNRTLAEAAVEWMYYHPESDPLVEVELAPP